LQRSWKVPASGGGFHEFSLLFQKLVKFLKMLVNHKSGMLFSNFG